MSLKEANYRKADMCSTCKHLDVYYKSATATMQTLFCTRHNTELSNPGMSIAYYFKVCDNFERAEL